MNVDALTSEAGASLVAQADAAKAVDMGAYMKTEMPFYGVQMKGIDATLKVVAAAHKPESDADYRAAVLALWKQPHREEKHLAIRYARRFSTYISMENLDVYRILIVEGAWWDLVDDVASNLVGTVLRNERNLCTPVLRTWIGSDDLWLRRTSIITQLRHGADTDVALLGDACIANMAETDFFLRKAIGWALREYAKTNPEWVIAFVTRHRTEMAPLSIREATKHLPSSP